MLRVDIFSLDEIFHIWDTLLLSPPSFSLFIACAIMRQLKEYLMPLDFNACIHLFSSLPALNIEECLKDAKNIMNLTPPSVTTLNENSVSALILWMLTDLICSTLCYSMLCVETEQEVVGTTYSRRYFGHTTCAAYCRYRSRWRAI